MSGIKDYGFPDRTFFEIFDAPCNGRSANKIYSVQVKDWKKLFSKMVQKGDAQQDVNVQREYDHEYVPTAAVVQVDMDQSVPKGGHLRVLASNALVKFLKQQGVELSSSEIYVTPNAFEWTREGEFDPETNEPFIPSEDDEPAENQKQGKKRALLALAVAALSLLS